MSVAVIHLKSPVRSLVARDAVRVPPEATLSEAAQIMQSEGVSAVLVGPFGDAILTEKDLARAVAMGCPPDCFVTAFATRHPVSVPADSSIMDAAAIMLRQEIRHLVVDFDGETLGVVSLRAIFAVLLQASNPEPWLESVRIHVQLQPSDAWIG